MDKQRVGVWSKDTYTVQEIIESDGQNQTDRTYIKQQHAIVHFCAVRFYFKKINNMIIDFLLFI